VAENAARVLTNEGLAESYNIAAFLGKTKGSDLPRYPVPLHQGDVLVLDEASQLSTADWALIQQAARSAGALVVPTGDAEQLGPVEAGGMFPVLAETLGAVELTEVRRFASQWERDASLRLRQGDKPVLAAYDTRGRIRGLHREAAYSRAAGAWLADHLRGKDVLLLAGSNAEAAELARLVQAQLIKAGSVHVPVHRPGGREPRRRR
jgi:ATP-dependent exoDNAse (exonuclease V) alpha subunit